MTTEETELTFVRCSNCRSLIPAIATRCRMCGAQFEKKADAGDAQGSQDPQSQNRQSRVRQRTISASADEVEQIKKDAFPAQEERQSSSGSASFRLGGGAPRPEPTQSESIKNYSAPKPVEDDLVDEAAVSEEDYDEALATRHNPSKEEFRFVDRVSEQDDDWNDEGDGLSEDASLGEEEEEDLHDDIMSDSGGNAEPARGDGRRKRRRRRRKRSQNPLTNEGPEQAADYSRAEAEAPVEASHYQRPEPERMAAPMASNPRDREPRDRDQRDREQPREREPRERESRRHEAQASSGEVQATGAEGKLVGWLVTFADNAYGESMELRAGRFFLGRQKLRGNDFIIPHPSISTPHCMIVAGGADSLVIQDLMSESGTQLRRSGESSYTPLTNAISVQHGDWVRFGQYEAMVCLLPKGRAS